MMTKNESDLKDSNTSVNYSIPINDKNVYIST